MTAPERAERSGRAFSFLRFRAVATPQLDLRYLGRIFLHAALVGAVTGLAGSLFFVALELTQGLLLERLAGYLPLRAHGEMTSGEVHLFRPWLMIVLPAIGALAGGLLTLFAPEARGGGGDATIEAFH